MLYIKFTVVTLTLGGFIYLASYAYGWGEARGMLNNYGGPVHIVHKLHCYDDWLSQLTCRKD